MTHSIEFHFDQPEESPGYLLWQTTMLWQRQMNRVLSEIDLTHTQFVILAALGWLSKSSNEVSQKEIADHSNTDRMMVSKVLRRLQEKGFIDRTENQKDTRSKLVHLTKNGKSKLQKALKVVESTDVAFFSALKTGQSFHQQLSQLISTNKES